MGEKKIKDPDVTVVLIKDGMLVNGSGDVLKGRDSVLGTGMLGFMSIGDK